MRNFTFVKVACAGIVLAITAFSTVAEARSNAARHAFARTNACPSTGHYRLPCPGYVIDHIKALDCGGADKPSNMQWQTLAEGRAKDKWERNGAGCKHRTRG